MGHNFWAAIWEGKPHTGTVLLHSDTHIATSAFPVAWVHLPFAASFFHSLPCSLAMFPNPALAEGSLVAIPKYIASLQAGRLCIAITDKQNLSSALYSILATENLKVLKIG